MTKLKSYPTMQTLESKATVEGWQYQCVKIDIILLILLNIWLHRLNVIIRVLIGVLTQCSIVWYLDYHVAAVLHTNDYRFI